MRRVAGIALAALAISGTLLTPSPATAAEPRPIKELAVYLHGTKNGHTHFLDLKVYPRRGIAMVQTVIEDAHVSVRARGVVYGVAIPSEPSDGSLDVTVPGLGEFVGAVSTESEGATAAKKCRSSSEPATEFGTFEGRIQFRGAGGYESWNATHAEAGVTRYCSPHALESATPDELFGAVSELGPILPGPSLFRLFAETKDHSLEFITLGNRTSAAAFAGIDREWLPGEVATERWVDWWGVPFSRAITAGPAGSHPMTVVFRPPPPFFGVGHYSRRSHTLTGSLGANFLGLHLRLTHRPLRAALADEEVAVG